MESAANIELLHWEAKGTQHRISVRTFAATVLLCAAMSALFASWAPLTLSIVTVFLFAGPHKWFELRYFLMRMPVRLGR